MNVLNFSETRAKLKAVMESVVRAELLWWFRKNGKSVMVVSRADWNAGEETTYLLSHKANAERLEAAIKQLDAGNHRPTEAS